MPPLPHQHSAYVDKLTGTSKARYLEKLSACEIIKDPYAVEEESWDASPDEIPNVEWNNLYLYMIATPSQHTREEIRVSVTWPNLIKFQLCH